MSCLGVCVQILVIDILNRIQGSGYGMFKLFKDAAVMGGAFVFLGESLISDQLVGYAISFLAIMTYYMASDRPGLFIENGIVGGVIQTLGFGGSAPKSQGLLANAK